MVNVSRGWLYRIKIRTITQERMKVMEATENSILHYIVFETNATSGFKNIEVNETFATIVYQGFLVLIDTSDSATC